MDLAGTFNQYNQGFVSLQVFLNFVGVVEHGLQHLQAGRVSRTFEAGCARDQGVDFAGCGKPSTGGVAHTDKGGGGAARSQPAVYPRIQLGPKFRALGFDARLSGKQLFLGASNSWLAVGQRGPVGALKCLGFGCKPFGHAFAGGRAQGVAQPFDAGELLKAQLGEAGVEQRFAPVKARLHDLRLNQLQLHLGGQP